MKAAPRLVYVLLLACGCGESVLEPHYRFVEPSLRAERSSLPPVSTLDNETRPTLIGHRARTLMSAHRVRVPPTGLVVMQPHVPRALRGAKRLLVQPRVYRDHRWQALPRVLVPVKTRQDGTEYVEVGFVLMRVGKKVEVSLKALVVPEAHDPVHETPPVEIARGSTLEFGIGLLTAGAEQSAVDFSIEACEALECAPLFEHTLVGAKPGGVGWEDYQLPLDEYAGREIAFRFRAQHQRADPEAFAFPVWSDPTVFRPRPAVPGETNFILISIDTLRADHLPWHGYRRNTAPRLAQNLAPHATIFDQCVAPASTTGPSHMTLFTSLQPLVHGIRRAAGSRQIPPAVRTLAQVLRAGGLVTGAVTENGPLGIHKGFGRGFDTFRENKAPKIRTAFSGRVAATLESARAWLERHADRRFFLFLHTYEPHTPYIAPGIYNQVFAGDPDSPRFDRVPHGEKPIDYDREIRYADDEIAEFLFWLAERGLLDDTILILTSDHGEAFMEHGYRFHGATLYEEILRVPLLVSGPGVVPGRVPVPVGLIDLMPTILELAGLPPSRQALGRSLVPWLRAEEVDPDPWMSRAIYSEAWQTRAATSKRVRVRQPTFAVRRGHRKLIRYLDGPGHRYSYYDLANDPRERYDLYSQMPQVAAELREMIDRYQPVSEALRAALQVEPADHADEEEIDPEREEKLRALGYID